MDLLKVNDLNKQEILSLINSANEYKNGKVSSYNFEKNIATIFLEPSTRTSISFDVAMKKLKINNVGFSANNSSLIKGETFIDTIKTIDSYDMDAIIIRSEIDEYFNMINTKAPIINAGDGKSNHPTQSLLDLMTIHNEFGSFNGLKVLIIGDILHSRVAKSNISIMQQLDMQVDVCAPIELRDPNYNYVEMKNIKNYDVVMLLRIQHERHSSAFDMTTYNTSYGLNKDTLKQLNDKAIIMHPGPFNLGVELTNDVIEDPRCRIYEQVNNGLYMRMAVIEQCIS